MVRAMLADCASDCAMDATAADMAPFTPPRQLERAAVTSLVELLRECGLSGQ